jgi:hypothetical protein
MFLVELSCSDPGCEAEVVLWVDDLDEAELIACECGYGLVTVRIEGAVPLVAVV